MPDVEKANEIFSKLKEQRIRRDKLEEELDRSMALQALWPEAWDGGSLKCSIEYLSRNRHVYRMTRGDGVAKDFSLKKVTYDRQAIASVQRECIDNGKPIPPGLYKGSGYTTWFRFTSEIVPDILIHHILKDMKKKGVRVW